MASKLKLSQKSTQQVDALSRNLNLKRNIICRIALGISLNITEPPNDESDASGQEFNQPTIIGTDESIITMMIANQYNMHIPADEFFSKYVRLEINRGLELLYLKYASINSSTDFMKNILIDTTTVKP